MNRSTIFKKNAIALAVGTTIMFGGLNSIAYGQSVSEDDGLEEVVVTGSRIQRADLTSATPVQVVGVEDIEFSALTNIGDLVNQLPSAGTPLFNRTNSNFDTNNSGVVNINFRDLGIARTLTLVNGRRFVAGVPGNSAVDLNTLPTALIEQVEIVTGGASAVYGSDAIAGVVNFKLKDDFEGIEISTRYEESDRGDGEETIIDFLAGSNFADDRGNATLSIIYTDQGSVFSRDRERTAIDSVSSVFFGGGVFEQTRPFFSSFPPQGRFDVSGTGSSADDFTFLPDGTLVNSFSSNGGDGRGADGFNRSAFRTIAIPTERFIISSNIRYDINEKTNVFFEGSYANTETVSALEPFPLASNSIFTSGSGGLPLRYANSAGNQITNPFLPAEIIQAADSNGVDNIFFTRRLFEFGGRGAFNERQTYRAVFGLEGELANDLKWDVSFNYGQTTQAQRSQGQVDIRAFRQALLSEVNPDNGQIRCVDEFARADGCVPINIFGFNTVSQAALDYVSADQTRNAKVTQQILQANLTGKLFELPAGDLRFAAGIEYRNEESEAISDALTVRGLNSSNAIPNVIGEFDVTEVYGELDIPLVNEGFVDYIGLGFAARASDYSTVGSTSTFEGRLEIRPVESFTLRGSVSRAVRAPNVGELFNPGSQTFAQVSDPCAGVTAATAGVVADNCRANPGIAQRIAATGAFTLTQPELQGTTGFIGGNPELDEEEADTFTAGFVFVPGFLADSLNASLTVDYFDIEVNDAIFAVTQNNVLNLCYQSVGLSSPLCDNVVRFGTNSPFLGALDEVNSGSANVGSISTSGVDVAVRFDFSLDRFSLPGSLGVSTAYTYLDKFEIVNLPDTPADNERGEIGNAENKFTTDFRYTSDNLSVALQLRYIGESRIEDQDLDDEACADIDCVTGGVLYSDIQTRYVFRESFFGNDVELFGGVKNITDEEAPIVAAGLSNSDTGVNTVAGVYDAIGRSYYIGAKVKF